MNYSSHRPYLIIPKLIEQPTWGGRYILELKNWLDRPSLKDNKIGQSYELFGGSKLTTKINDSRDFRFVPEIGSADSATTKSGFSLLEDKDYIQLSDLVAKHPVETLGTKVKEKFGVMPLLLKLNQAFGNSFQLHLKPSITDPRWKAKPESWYYLEPGLLTCGIKPGIDISEYKKTCEEIEGKMIQLSAMVQSDEMSLDDAKQEAKEYIQKANPWQYVNTYESKKYELIDLSAGGIHHSWEENKEKFPQGNIVYEVQLDVMDPVCTIRSFDQGKFKADGSIREIHIEDYFKYMDTDAERNDITNLRKTRNGNNLLTTSNYSLDIREVTQKMTDTTGSSFCHLYVRDGEVEINTKGGSMYLTRGHSCFLPQAVGEYAMIPHSSDTVILKTYTAA